MTSFLPAFCFDSPIISSRDSNSLNVLISGQDFIVPISGPFRYFSSDELKFLPLDIKHDVEVGGFGNTLLKAIEVNVSTHLSQDLELCGLKVISHYELMASLDEEQKIVTARAVQLLRWKTEHKFCGQCGEKTRPADSEKALECPGCKIHYWPRISPCVIVLVHRGDELLLARNKKFPLPIYSTIAGFIESGEPAEDAVKRETLEETNVVVDQVSYFKSQNWPFPSQLMLGFFAKYQSGSVQADGDEIIHADFYKFDQLPRIPMGSASIAAQLIAHATDCLKQGKPIA